MYKRITHNITEEHFAHPIAAELQFEVAARLRDEIKLLKKELRMMEEAGV